MTWGHTDILRPASRPAFTLLELVVSMAITTILVFAIASAIVLAGGALPRTDDPQRPTRDAWKVAHEIAWEIQFAIAFAERSLDAVEFYVPSRDGDNLPERIRYWWSGTAGDPLLRRYNAGASVVVIDSVYDFNLTYEQSDVEVLTPTEIVSAEMELASYDSTISLGEAHVHYGAALFADDFEDGVITGWTSFGEKTLEESGGVLKTQPGLESDAEYAINGGAGWAEYTFEADIRSVDNDVAGLIFRLQDDDNYYLFRHEFGGPTWNCILEKVVNNAASAVVPLFDNFGAAAGQINNPNTWYTFKVVVSGTNIKCYIDDVLKFDVNDATFASGTAGLYLNSETDSQFDNVVVQSSPPEPRIWWAQYFKPTLPVEATEWSVSRVKFMAMEDDDPLPTIVDLRVPAVDLTPSKTVLDSETIDAVELTNSWVWIEKFLSANQLPPGEGLCMVFRNTAGRSARLRYQHSAVIAPDLGLMGGSEVGWLPLAVDQSLLFYVYGTYTSPGPPDSDTRHYLTAVEMEIQTSADESSEFELATTLFHTPEIDQ